MIDSILLIENIISRRLTLEMMVERQLALPVASFDNLQEAQNSAKNNIRAKIVLISAELARTKDGGILGFSEVWKHTPVIVLTETSTHFNTGTNLPEVADFLRRGAFDFLTFPTTDARLEATITNALKFFALRHEAECLRKMQAGRYFLDDFAGAYGSLKNLVQTARKAAHSDLPLLITGENGTEKERLARAIHASSKRASGPFTVVHAGVPDASALENFSSDSALEKAKDGTVFIEDIEMLSAEEQLRLERLLKAAYNAKNPQERPFDFRIMASSREDLSALVKRGAFREDLYYGMQYFPLHIPPLRERNEDIATLAVAAVVACAAKEQKHIAHMDDEALKRLARYSWPGNERELNSVIHRAVLMAAGPVMTRADVEPYLTAGESYAAAGSLTVALEDADGNIKTMEKIEQDVITALLRQKDATVAKVSDQLGIGQATIYRKKKTVNR